MKNFKRVLLGMDLSNTDLKLLDYLKLLSKSQHFEAVYCSHVVRAFDVPSFVLDEMGGMTARPLDERLKKNLQDEISLKIRPNALKIQVDVLEGKLTQELLHWSEVKGIDLAIFGRKKQASSLAARRFLRRSNCSVLFVPSSSKAKIKRIALATDYSQTSTYVLLETLKWIEQMEEKVQLELIHVYDVPSGVRAQLGDVPEILLNRIREAQEKFGRYYLETLGLNPDTIQLRLVENTHINPGIHIQKAAQSSKADLLLLGAYGHSFLENLIVGSVSERILELDSEIPLLVVRPPKEAIKQLPTFSIKNFKKIDYAEAY
ncbi:MAG: universal stress protein [Bacteroidota bacterium]